jgi:hypothetical protein
VSLPFAKYEDKAWPYWYKGELVVREICGGVPADENTAESWIKTKLKDTRSDAEVRELVEKTKREIRETHAAARHAMTEGHVQEAGDLLVMEDLSGLQADLMDDLTAEGLERMAVAKSAKDLAGLNIFKQTREGVLHIEGRQLKAALKEAVAVAANAGKITTKGWGRPDNASYKKGIKQWFPEHVFVVDEILPLYREDGSPVTSPDETLQKFVHTHRGDAISYEECVRGAHIRFTVKTDVPLSEEEWAMIWLSGQDQGLGASRSQGFGTYTVVSWEKVKG